MSSLFFDSKANTNPAENNEEKDTVFTAKYIKLELDGEK
jgi:hypothetical protein